ncbi:MAG: transposase [Alphaproteobacteria bacterium]|nr:transposase [Alphaproteobacteria bacterium]
MSGAERRRRWSAAEKASIVAESFAPGAIARQVALRHGLHPNQIYAWRCELATVRRHAAREALPGFVPVAVARSGSEMARLASGMVEIELCGAIVRIAPGVVPEFLRVVLSAVKAS